jgi:hypothetical protein
MAMVEELRLRVFSRAWFRLESRSASRRRLTRRSFHSRSRREVSASLALPDTARTRASMTRDATVMPKTCVQCGEALVTM